jgi:hypothetical protein
MRLEQKPIKRYSNFSPESNSCLDTRKIPYFDFDSRKVEFRSNQLEFDYNKNEDRDLERMNTIRENFVHLNTSRKIPTLSQYKTTLSGAIPRIAGSVKRMRLEGAVSIAECEIHLETKINNNAHIEEHKSSQGKGHMREELSEAEFTKPRPLKVIRRRKDTETKVFETKAKPFPKAMLEGVELLTEKELEAAGRERN